MRVAIFGAGGLGSYVGGLQARAGRDVTFIARGANLEALRSKGLSITLEEAGEQFTVPVRATNDPADVGPVDLVWLCVKNYDLDPALEATRPLVGPDTAIISGQNGVDAPEQIAAAFGPQHVVVGVARTGATLEAPGVLVQRGRRARIQLGELDGGLSKRVESLAEELRGAGLDVEARADMQATLWEKYVGFCAQSAVCTITRLPPSVVRTVPETRDLMAGIMSEVEALGRAKGVKLPEGLTNAAMSAPPTLQGAAAFPSMYHDFVNGRRIEVEALQGAAVRMGKELGVPTPLTFAAYALLKPFENGAP